jgi:hypothetical protein
MTIRYTRYHGVRVSKRWAVVLHRAHQADVRFTLDSGKRTMREQWRLWRTFKRVGHPTAAFPSPVAPHIRTGRADHALDVNALDGGANRLAGFLRSDPRNARVTFTVPGEPWHLEIRGRDLTRLWRKYR